MRKPDSKMKNKIIVLLCLVAIGLNSCADNFSYMYAEKPAMVDCDQMDQKMLNEAMYTFQEDVAVHYNFKNYSPTTPVYYRWGFASYVHHGSNGTAPYAEIVSEQSKLVLLELVKEDGLFLKENEEYVLNFKHPLASCLIDLISDDAIKETIKTLISVDQMQARLLDSPLRSNIKRLVDDKNLLLFVGLATYYPRLMNMGVHLPQESE